MNTFIGIDTGGTFTDFVVVQADRLQVHKVLSTPDAPERAILQGLKDLAVDLQHAQIVHGSTVATNAVLEGKGVTTVYICNQGLADVLTIGRQARKSLYDLQPKASMVPVPAEFCIETGGRLNAEGIVIHPLTQQHLDHIVQRLQQLKPKAVAINLLFSFLDDECEKRIEAVIPKEIFVSRSSKVLPEYREYERGMATWLNAWIGPLMRDYLQRLEDKVKPANLSVMQSSGHTVAAQQAGEFAVNLLLSGPAGGLRGAQYSGHYSAKTRLMTFDMGGTSTDVALIDGDIQLSTQNHIGDFPVAVPMVNMHTIGAGGGSIAYVDEGGLLQVGPESAGADPGPACYGQGGEQATVTDANLFLGRLPKQGLLGGQMPLQAAKAEQVIAKLAAQLHMGLQETALGIIQLANQHMSNALQVISVAKGYDPKEFCLVSFGGAGGLHVCALAESLQMTQALVPNHAGVLSALGMVVAPRGRQLSRTHRILLAEANESDIKPLFAQLEQQGRQALEQEGVSADSIEINTSLDLRYQGQTDTLNVAWKNPKVCVSLFHQEHKRRFGHAMELPVECVNLRVELHSPGGLYKPPAANLGQGGLDYILTRDAVGTGVEGPRIIVDAHATTFLHEGWFAHLDKAGNMLLNRKG